MLFCDTEERTLPNITSTNSISTALLVFARTPQADARLKSFVRGGGAHQNLQVATALLEHTLQEARDSGMSVFWLDGSQQYGDTFGERLANAMEAIWSKGFDQQIVIGSDIPELDASILRNAEDRLKENEWVLGPSEDGGTYLIGMRRSAYDRQAMLDQPWLTASVFESLQSNLAGHPGCVLSELADIDTAADLIKVTHRVDTPFVLLLKSLLAPQKHNTRKPFARPITNRSFATKALRAPPALAA